MTILRGAVSQPAAEDQWSAITHDLRMTKPPQARGPGGSIRHALALSVHHLPSH